MKTSHLYRFGKITLTCLSKILFRMSVSGRENFPEGPAIIASNHTSFIDPPIVGIAAPEAVRYLARASLFRYRFTNWLYRKLGAIPIRRDSADTSSIRTILRTLDEGDKIVMFPEGGRSRDGTFQKPMRGLGYIICKAKVPVIPAYVHGTFEVLPPHRAIIHFSKIVVSFGRPSHFDGVWSGRPSKEDYETIGAQIMERIAELRTEVLKR